MAGGKEVKTLAKLQEEQKKDYALTKLLMDASTVSKFERKLVRNNSASLSLPLQASVRGKFCNARQGRGHGTTRSNALHVLPQCRMEE